ncbi:MAG TPA: hypothetical protein VED59_00945 [Acidimicrobiales bacterium]|nr:hypothetical protein [Acidimicrobiales bacterium]
MSTAEEPRGAEAPPAAAHGRPRLSLDWWSVITSLLLAALVRGGLLRKVPW